MESEPITQLTRLERLSLIANDLLADSNWEYKSELDQDIRQVDIKLDPGRRVHVFQSRNPINYEEIRNIFQLMTTKFGRLSKNQYVMWDTGHSELKESTFSYIDDIEKSLHEAHEIIKDNG